MLIWLTLFLALAALGLGLGIGIGSAETLPLMSRPDTFCYNDSACVSSSDIRFTNVYFVD